LLVVNLYQSDAGLIVFPANDGGIGTGSEADGDGRFQIVRKSEAIAGDQSSLVCITLPVVVRRKQHAVLVEHLEPLVRQQIGDAKLRERRVALLRLSRFSIATSLPDPATSPAAVNRLTRLWIGEVGTV
jgi:hypothetical protein